MTKGWIEWSPEKNERLKKQRGLSFEDVETALELGRVLDNFPHPNARQYPNQRILVVEIEGYAYNVPFVVNGDSWFLKTVFPSRKATKLYLKRDDNEPDT